ncbi:MAG: glycosyltransferase family 4 protein [Methanoregula sp.]|jgi:glycosyltransferase involved in cell wall biosynthesis|uniref:glycosyltransferase family 4 protein n=1 Tax=Methanoregula sp. TaxID=2052170 RepID=UPI003C13A711
MTNEYQENPIILLLIADSRSIHTQRWAEYFAQRGHVVHLITYDPMNRTIPGVTEYVLTSRWNNLYLAFIPRHLAIKKLVRQINPDLIHAHFIAKYGFHLSGPMRCPTIVSAWGDDILILPKKSRLIAYYTKKVLDGADLIYAISKNIKDHIMSDFAIPETKVRYLPFGIDTDLFSPLPGLRREDSPSIEIFSNRGFFPVYDNETLILGFALAYQKNPALRLTLKGDGPLERVSRELVSSLGLPDVITFRQKTAYADVPNDYRRADIFITTSVSDGTPVSILEAMASGLPCIATTVGGIPEWIENNKTGLLIPPRSPEAVASAILSLAADPALRSHLGSAAREMIVKNGQWNSLMAQAEKDYLALLETYRQDTP